jgi:hypothetical protein
VKYSEPYRKKKDTGIPWVSVILVLTYEAFVVAIFQFPEIHYVSLRYRI